MLTKKTLKIICKEITDIKLTFSNKKSTYFYFDTDYCCGITLNPLKLNEIPIKTRKNRKINVKEFLLIVLLHEIGHYKHFLKYPRKRTNFLAFYIKNPNYTERLADRYAKRYYKKILKIYK